MKLLTLQPHSTENRPVHLRLLLVEHDRYQRLRLTRLTLVHALAGLGLVVWAIARWPGSELSWVRGFTLTAWIAGFVAALFVGLQEWECHRRILRLAEPPPRRG